MNTTWGTKNKHSGLFRIDGKFYRHMWDCRTLWQTVLLYWWALWCTIRISWATPENGAEARDHFGGTINGRLQGIESRRKVFYGIVLLDRRAYSKDWSRRVLQYQRSLGIGPIPINALVMAGMAMKATYAVVNGEGRTA